MLAIVCIDNRWGIGRAGDQHYYLKPDLKRFRRWTENRVVIFGRRTMQTFPGGQPLRKRHNILLSNSYAVSNLSESRDDTPFYVVNGRDQLHIIKKHLIDCGYREDDFVVIGGASVYREFLPEIDRVLVTRVLQEYESDTYFPNLDEQTDWQLYSSSDVEHDEETGLDYLYQEYRRTTIEAQNLHIKDAKEIAGLKLPWQRDNVSAIKKWIRHLRIAEQPAFNLLAPDNGRSIGIALGSSELVADHVIWTLLIDEYFLSSVERHDRGFYAEQILKAIADKYPQDYHRFILPSQLVEDKLSLDQVRSIEGVYRLNPYQVAPGYLVSRTAEDFMSKQFCCMSFEHINLCIGMRDGLITDLSLLDHLQENTPEIWTYLKVNNLLTETGELDREALREQVKRDGERFSENLLYRRIKRQLSEYFLKKRTAFTLPLEQPEDSDFRKAVWQVIAQIPYGQTLSYEEVAIKTLQLLGKQQDKAAAYARAVGMACSANPLAIVVPCHRVIGKDNSLRGFAAGTKIKANLLDREILGI